MWGGGLLRRRGGYGEVGVVEASADELYATRYRHVTARLGATCPLGGEDRGASEQYGDPNRSHDRHPAAGHPTSQDLLSTLPRRCAACAAVTPLPIRATPAGRIFSYGVGRPREDQNRARDPARCRPAHAGAALRGARAALRSTGPFQMREPAAHRIV